MGSCSSAASKPRAAAAAPAARKPGAGPPAARAPSASKLLERSTSKLGVAAVVVTAAHVPRTGVASIEDLPGENDGCDRFFGKDCDEEACCPSFWQDEGVPDLPILSWVFSRTNPYTNDNDYAAVLGGCGLRSADRERKALMGTALTFTVFSIILTTFGCLALAPDAHLTTATAWAIGTLENPFTQEGTRVYVGLAQLVLMRCSDAPPGVDPRLWSSCELNVHRWPDVARICAEGAAAEERALELAEGRGEDADKSLDSSGQELTFDLGYPCAPLLACSEQVGANQFGAFVTCFTLIFALIGCLTRIRKRADTNFQKIIGTFPDMIGILTLGGALATFSARCTSSMLADDNEVGTGYSAGPGFIAYCFCWFAAVVRFSMHASMPVPSSGLGVHHVGQIGDAMKGMVACLTVDVPAGWGLDKPGQAAGPQALTPPLTPRGPRPAGKPGAQRML